MWRKRLPLHGLLLAALSCPEPGREGRATHTFSHAAANGEHIYSCLPRGTQPVIEPSCFLTASTFSAEGQGEKAQQKTGNQLLWQGKENTQTSRRAYVFPEEEPRSISLS